MIGVLSLLTCIPSLRQRERQKAIFYFQIPHNTLCLPHQILQKPLFSNAPGSTTFFQEYLKTIPYAKFGGQTVCYGGFELTSQ